MTNEEAILQLARDMDDDGSELVRTENADVYKTKREGWRTSGISIMQQRQTEDTSCFSSGSSRRRDSHQRTTSFSTSDGLTVNSSRFKISRRTS
jgi:hypothetical protein